MRRLVTRRRALGKASAASAALATLGVEPGAGAAGPAPGQGFPAPVTALWTGSHSHWLQPWRTMIATRSLDAIENGLGIQNSDLDHPDSLAMFRQAGFRHVRIGVNWSDVSTENPGLIPNGEPVAALIRFVHAAHAAGLRPLVLLQAFSQAPCPHRTRLVRLAEAAAAGSRTLTLAATDGLAPGRSGLTAWWPPGSASPVGNYIVPSRVMCAVLFTGLDGRTVRLSRPLPAALPQGSLLVIDTLAHPPFGAPGTPEYDASMRGWRDYVGAVGRFMTGLLGTAGASDRGFDLEVWNEVTFGSEFLDINNYYDPPKGPRPEQNGEPAIIPALVAETATAVAAGGEAFRGVRVADGFASVTPQPASSREPARVSALTKHPYPTPQSYPAADGGKGGLDRFGQPTSFVPRYTMYAHEWFSTAISPFTLARDIATTPNDFGGVMHGVDARRAGGTVSPVTVWMTEIGTAANAVGVSDPSARTRLVAKGTLRALFFNLAIGVERLYLFRGVGALDFFSLVPPEAPTTPTLPLVALRRALDFMRTPGAAAAAAPRRFDHALALRTGRPPARLFAGNGTPNCPDMVRGDDFVLAPVAVTPRRTAFIAWFIGLDMRDTMAPVPATLRIAGLSRAIGSVTALDPLTGRSPEVSHTVEGDGRLAIETVFDDVPLVLVVTETG